MIIDKERIRKAKEKLGEKNADIIAEVLQLANYDEHNHKSLCPFHVEDTPSFIYNPKAYNYHCFGACGRNYDIIDAYMLSGMTYMQAVQKLFEVADVKYSFGEVGVQTQHLYKYPQPKYASNKEQVYDYWAKRGISKTTIDYLDIQQDERGNTLFQYYDTNDVLTVCKVRPSRKVPHGECKVWYLKDEHGNPYDSMPILYNMNKINVDSPLLICSGEGDCAAAIEAGWTNAVSICGGDQNTRWVNECWDWLEQFNEIIICPDNDESGNKYCKQIIPRLGSWRCKIAVVPEWYEVDGVRKAHVKDINDCLYYMGKDCVLNIITHAQDSPIQSVKDLSDVEDVDLDDIDGIYTGIDGIDRELMKIFYGTLTVVSGMPGSGKTSFLYQLICNALDQDINSWLYSKELPDWMTKNWFNFIFGGRRHIKEYVNSKGAKYYKVTPDAKKKIDDHYRGKWFVYRDDYGNTLDELIESMTDVVRKCGVKFLILDNMMTIDIGANDKNELLKQTETINRLIQFSMKYNVATILVAHPRKLLNTSELGMYDISGTANIANLAHRTIGLRRISPKEKQGEPNKSGKGFKVPPCKYDVMFSVIKDRIRGRANFTYGLYYDTHSRRFFSNPEEFAHNYKWDTTQYQDQLEYPIIDETTEVFGSPC